MRNILFVLSGPSGVGKGTIAELIKKRNENVALSISCTTRRPRDYEKSGVEYFFITREEYKEKIENGGFLEYSEHFGNLYGTPKDFVKNRLKEKDVLLEIDVNGGLQAKRSFPETVLIFIAPPSVNELKRRLSLRHTETDEQIEKRLERIDYEMEKGESYDYKVVNDDLETAVSEIEKIIEKEKNIFSKGERI